MRHNATSADTMRVTVSIIIRQILINFHQFGADFETNQKPKWEKRTGKEKTKKDSKKRKKEEEKKTWAPLNAA